MHLSSFSATRRGDGYCQQNLEQQMEFFLAVIIHLLIWMDHARSGQFTSPDSLLAMDPRT